MLLLHRAGRYAGVLTVATLAGLAAAGCSKEAVPPPEQQTAQAPGGGPGGGPPGGGMGGGRRGGPGGRRGRGGPIASTASASEIYQQRCQGCHGAQGQGGRGGVPLADAKTRTPDALKQTIRDGRNRMTPFAGQMTAAQLDAVVAYVRKLSPPPGG